MDEDAMQRGYTLCTMDLAKVISVDKENQTFEWIDIASTQSINRALCFYDKTEARNVQKRIIEYYDGDLPESQVVNVAKLYGKVL